MEHIYNTSLLPYSSRTICLKEFFENAETLIQPYVQEKATEIAPGASRKLKEEFMLALLGDEIDSAVFKRLSTACSSDKLQVPDQPSEVNVSVSKRTRAFEKVQIPKDVDLETLKIRSTRLGKSLRHLRYSPSIWLDHIMSESWDVDANTIDLIPGESLLVVIKIYQPFKHRVGEPMSRVPQPLQQVAILGTNTLAEFRDKISCLSDNLVSCDTSDNPSLREVERGIDKYPSGMFYIDNKFYIDKRDPRGIDYSQIIKEWGAERNIKLGETFLMENTKFEDLSIRLGYPYLYQHQGSCEHLFCFTDVRILHESDPLQSSAYPLITCYFRRNVSHCMCCTNSVARWLTSGNARLPHDPFYFCEECFLSFNYVDGKKVGEFKAYPIVSFNNEEPEETTNEV